MLKKISGFSLIEVMIVIAIIAILIATALPSYQKYTKRAHYMEVIQATAPLKLAVVECYEIMSDLSGCVSGAHGIPNANHNMSATLVNTNEVLANGVIHIIPNNKYGITQKQDYFLTPKANKAGLTWHSSGGGVQAGYSH